MQESFPGGWRRWTARFGEPTREGRRALAPHPSASSESHPLKFGVERHLP